MKTIALTLAAALGLFIVQDAQSGGSAMPGEGDEVPAFRLNDHTGRAVRIAPPEEDDEERWTIVAFFPKAATPG